MHKFLMVDDEDVIRTGFREKIDWEGLGFEFLEPCANGLQALEAIEKYRPDVVMTDICMPLMDGLELSRVLARDYPEIKVVVLSGHDDFEYARESLRHRVLDYILKPLTSEDLNAFLGRLRLSLGKPAELVESEAVRRLLDGTLALGRTLPLEGELALRWPSAWWTVGRLTLAPSPGESPSPFELMGRVEALLARRNFPWPGLAAASVRRGGKVVQVDVLFPDNDPIKGALRAQRESHRLLADARQNGFLAAGALSQPCQGSQDLPRASADAVQATLLRFTSSDSLFGGLNQRPAASGAELEPFVARLELLVREGDRASAESFLADLDQALGQAAVPPAKLHRLLVALISLVAGQEATDPDELLETWFDRNALVQELSAHLLKTLNQVSHQGASLAERAFRRFRHSITERFGNPDLTLEEISRDLHVSPSYLSKILRRRLATNFSKYVREVRISKAKELLAATDLTTTQIAEETGFNDYRYFSNQFKRQVGTTPSGYRVLSRIGS